MNLQNFLLTLQPLAIKAVLVIIAYFVGNMLVNWLAKYIASAINKTKLDESLKPFLSSFIKIGLKVLLIISILSLFDVETATFAGVIAASGFAIGMAFSGALSNFAGGIFIITLKPFKLGDYIEAQGYQGVVEEINILNTMIVTVDNKLINLPNGSLSTSTIINYTAKPTRRVDIEFGVGYEQDIDKVSEVLLAIAKEHKLILKDPAPFARVSGHGDSAVFFTVRVWTNTENYWDVYFDLFEQVKKRFDAENISIPYPQMDVHMNNQ